MVIAPSSEMVATPAIPEVNLLAFIGSLLVGLFVDPSSGSPKELLGDLKRSVERGLLQAPRPVAWKLATGLAGMPSLQHGGVEAREVELPLVGVSGALVAYPANGDPRAVGGVENRSLDTRPRRSDRRPEPEPADPPNRVVVVGKAGVLGAAEPLHPIDQRRRAEVVGGVGESPLLGAGRGEPHVARRVERFQHRG